MIIASILVIAICLCACQKKEAEPETTQKASKPVATSAEKITTAPTTEAETEDDTKGRLEEISADLIKALNIANTISASKLAHDENDTYTDETTGATYYRVTDPDFQNYGDLFKFFERYFTKDYTDVKYGQTLNPAEGSPAQYIVANDGLYMMVGGKGVPTYKEDAPLTFSHIIDDAFSFEFEYQADSVNTKTAVVDAVLDGENWKVGNLTVKE